MAMALLVKKTGLQRVKHTKVQHVKTQLLGISAAVLFGMLPVSSMAEQGFYTIVDAQGRLINVPIDNKSTNNQNSSTQHLEKPSPEKPSPEKSNQAQQSSKPVKHIPNQVQTPLVQIPAASQAVQPTVKIAANPAVKNRHTVPVQKISTSTVATPVEQTRLADNATQAIPPANTKLAKAVSENPAAPNKDGLLEFDKTTYIDSTALAKKAFNQDDKKRFYSIPNAAGGVDQVEKRAGLNLVPANATSLPTLADFQVSANYQIISKTKLKTMLPASCVPATKLKKIKQLAAKNPVNMWPRAKAMKKNAKAFDLPVDMLRLDEKVSHIAVVSYAASGSQPAYYWPFGVFLNKQGCALSGVGSFYQQFVPATWLQQSAIKGNMIVPKNAVYLMMTPLAQSPDLAGKTLVNTGALQINAYDGERF